jgi:hypothetical protein
MQWNAAYIHPSTIDINPLTNYDDFLLHFDECKIASDDTPLLRTTDICSLLLSSSYHPIAKLYDRHPHINDWYYIFYGSDQKSQKNPLHTQNFIINAILPEITHAGGVVVVRGGPADGNWTKNDYVDANQLATTCWWYYRSGVSVTDEFGQREFQRWLSSTSF